MIMDEFSRFPVGGVVRSTSAETVIPVVDNVFSLLGCPENREIRQRSGRSMGTCGKLSCKRTVSDIER